MPASPLFWRNVSFCCCALYMKNCKRLQTEDNGNRLDIGNYLLNMCVLWIMFHYVLLVCRRCREDCTSSSVGESTQPHVVCSLSTRFGEVLLRASLPISRTSSSHHGLNLLVEWGSHPQCLQKLVWHLQELFSAKVHRDRSSSFLILWSLWPQWHYRGLDDNCVSAHFPYPVEIVNTGRFKKLGACFVIFDLFSCHGCGGRRQERREVPYFCPKSYKKPRFLCAEAHLKSFMTYFVIRSVLS